MGGRGGGKGKGGGGGGGRFGNTEAEARLSLDFTQIKYNEGLGKQRAFLRKHGPAGRNRAEYKQLVKQTKANKVLRDAAQKNVTRLFRTKAFPFRKRGTGRG